MRMDVWAGSVLSCLFISIRRTSRYHHGIAAICEHPGIATLTVESLVNGIMEIYGRSSPPPHQAIGRWRACRAL